MTQGDMPEGYQNIVLNRHESAETGVRRVFDSFSEMLSIQSTTYPANKTAHYLQKPSNGNKIGVYYNANADLNNKRGAGSTYYHELAHMIDHAAMDFQSNLSNTQEFYDALIFDGQIALRNFNSCTTEQQKAFVEKARENDRTHSLQDLLEATTNGQISIGWGHDPWYWGISGNLQAEAFAHFFEASMGAPDKLMVLQRFFPESFKVFQSMIEPLIPKIKEYKKTLTRSV